MRSTQSSFTRSKSMDKFKSKTSSRLSSPEKSKEKYRNNIKALRSSKFSQLFTKQSHKDILLVNYRDLRFTNNVKKYNTSASSHENLSPQPNEANKVKGKITIKRQKTLESFNDIIHKCKVIQKEFKVDDVVKGCKKLGVDLGRLKRSIEHFQVNEDSKRKIHSKTEKMLRNDSRRLRNQIEFSERKANKKCCIWKQKSGFLNRKTDKLIADVETRLRSREGFE